MGEEKLMEGSNNRYTSYRWLILFLLALSQVACNGSNIQLAALGGNLIEAYGLDPATFGAITNMSFLGGVILGIPSGALADRFGTKTILSILMVIGAVGSVLRIFATTAPMLFVTMFMLGLIMAGTSANSAKILSLWFPKSQLTIAMGVYIATSTLGAVLALATTPRLFTAGQTIPQIFTYGAILCVITAVLWLIFGKSRPKGAPDIKSESVMKHMGTVLKNPHMWIASIVIFLVMGCVMAMSTFLVVLLTDVKGVEYQEAANWSLISAIVFLVGCMILPTIIGRTGFLKRGYIILALILGVLIIVAWSMPYSQGMMVVLVIGFSLVGCGIPIHKQYPALMKKIPIEAIGSAGGMHATMQNLGAFLMPSLILGNLAGTNLSIIVYGSAVFLIISAILTGFLPEIGTKGDQRKGFEDIAE